MNSDIDKALAVEENDLGYASVVELASFDMELACVCYIRVLVGDVTVAETICQCCCCYKSFIVSL